MKDSYITHPQQCKNTLTIYLICLLIKKGDLRFRLKCIVKFTADEAQYAIDNMNADFNHNALEKAKSYQESMSMSPEAIRDQLTSHYGEKFTQAEADYAIANLDK